MHVRNKSIDWIMSTKYFVTTREIYSLITLAFKKLIVFKCRLWWVLQSQYQENISQMLTKALSILSVFAPLTHEHIHFDGEKNKKQRNRTLKIPWWCDNVH